MAWLFQFGFMKRRRYKSTLTLTKKLSLVAVIVLIFLGLAKISKEPKLTEEHFIQNPAVSYLTLTPTPSPTPLPTPTPTPTPFPLIGYCLHVPVLLYHHIQPDAQAQALGQKAISVDSAVFDQQMDYLATHGYQTIAAETLADALLNHTPLPQKSIVLTFDDGYSDIYTYAYPVFQKYHLTANLMIPTGLLGGSDYMSWGQLLEMTNSGLVQVSDHTWSHYAINNGPLTKIKYEIETAKQQLESNLGQKVNTFAYPYGVFDNRAISVLRQDGFTAAFSTLPGFWQCDSFIMTLHRNRIGNGSLSSYGL